MSETTTKFELIIDHSPVYELLISLTAFVQNKNHKSFDAGVEWVQRVQESLPADFSPDEFIPYCNDFFPVDLFILNSPVKHSVPEFMDWFAGLSVGELYQTIAQHMQTVSPDLEQQRDQTVSIMRRWNELYFQHLDPTILTELAADADAKRQLLESMEPIDVIELATNGNHFIPTEEYNRMILTPQYHMRPMTVASHYKNLIINLYSADVVPVAEGEPSTTLLRLTRSLSDERRLKMLRFLADSPRTFTEIVQFSGLAKSTVHHHLVQLRAAGLIRVHTRGTNVENYSLRSNALDELQILLGTYLKEL